MSDFHIRVFFNDYCTLIIAFLTKQIQNRYRYRRLPDSPSPWMQTPHHPWMQTSPDADPPGCRPLSPLNAHPLPPGCKPPSPGCRLPLPSACWEANSPPPPWTEGMTHTCENITLSQNSPAGGNDAYDVPTLPPAPSPKQKDRWL